MRKVMLLILVTLSASCLSCKQVFATRALIDGLTIDFVRAATYPFRLSTVYDGYHDTVFIDQRDEHLESLVAINNSKAYSFLSRTDVEQEVAIGDVSAYVQLYSSDYTPLVRWEFVKVEGCWLASALLFDVDLRTIGNVKPN